MPRILLSLLLSFITIMADAQVTFTKSMKQSAPDEITITFVGKVEKGWHIAMGTFSLDEIDGAKPVGELMHPENSVIYSQKIKLIKKAYKVKGYFQYTACNDSACLAPTNVEFLYEGPQSPTRADVSSIPQSQNFSMGNLLYIFLMDFICGLFALLTPCVWPGIPMTVSFFLKRSKHGVRDAILYGVSIIVIYLVLGLVVTAIFGASALNALSTNVYVNIFAFLLLVIFGVSLLGGYELTLPSRWSNAIDAKATATTGFLSIFLMALTLVLVSFSCTAPIVGFLLVEIGTSGNILGPAVGMFGFALALALPFTLFAIFPKWLKSLPKSGAWMKDIKVTLGVVELAFSLKFLSVADMAYGWGILSRALFLGIWVMLFVSLGIYLIRKKGLVRVLALCALAFAAYLVSGLWGAPCTAVSAFVPPETTEQLKDYDLGMAYAKKEGKPVMIDFTGYGCVNCRKMEGAVFTDERVKKILADDYVIIHLYVDDKTALPKPVTVMEHGTEVTLRTIGDKWSYLQRKRFGCNTQPFYVLLDNDGNPLNNSYSYDEDIDRFLDFLNTGLQNYKK